MQECQPLSIWNYLILLGDSNKNNNKDSQLGSIPSRYWQMFSSVSTEGITPACSQKRVTTFYPAFPLSCFLRTGLLTLILKIQAQSYPHSQVALNNKRNLPFYLCQKWRSKARQLVKNILYARQIRTLVV